METDTRSYKTMKIFFRVCSFSINKAFRLLFTNFRLNVIHMKITFNHKKVAREGVRFLLHPLFQTSAR